ncbi:hypothetical protein QVD17_02066 [Tagetes erecta]|uniref:Uncharacterized protein n=1 Tax=Tagetes erecta TaxID=13708 RepID=A0AAD8LD96_TARER|nr:hypothetical protein QVD17_02066 [Tagetes erecta]
MYLCFSLSLFVSDNGFTENGGVNLIFFLFFISILPKQTYSFIPWCFNYSFAIHPLCIHTYIHTHTYIFIYNTSILYHPPQTPSHFFTHTNSPFLSLSLTHLHRIILHKSLFSICGFD